MVIATTDTFNQCVYNLPKTVQKAILATEKKLWNAVERNGLNFEQIEGNSELSSIRVNRNYRIILKRDDAAFILLYVDKHSEAYSWAERHNCEINPHTFVVQVYEKIVSTATLRIETEKETNPIFSEFLDEELLELGVPDCLIGYVRYFCHKHQLEEAKDAFPHDAYEYLDLYANDASKAEVLAMARDINSIAVPTDDFEDALDNHQSTKNFQVAAGENDLAQALSQPMEKWRVYLHPSQKKLVEKSFNGPARVLGLAGTGKTVVAMHRASYLASHLVGTDEMLLFTTFSKTLAADIRTGLHAICTNEELAHIEVIHIDSWLSTFIRNTSLGFSVAYEGKSYMLTKKWDRALRDACLNHEFDAAFCMNEWEQVVVAQETFRESEYLEADRKGRGKRLTKAQRKKLWKVFSMYMKSMKRSNLRDIDWAMVECRHLIERERPLENYKHVIIDEGQDMSPCAYRLLRCIVGSEHPNDMFITGDAHQRIYDRRASLSKCGVHIRGRSTILQINYRTTEEIQAAGLKVLSGVDFDDLDEGVIDNLSAVSLTHGEEPSFQEFYSLDDEIDYMADTISELLEGGAVLANICVVAKTARLVFKYKKRLEEAGYPVYELKQQTDLDDRNVEGIRVATMHRVKGLEFDYIFIAGSSVYNILSSRDVRRAEGIGELENHEKTERSLLYVAMTRARKGLYITSDNEMSELLNS